MEEKNYADRKAPAFTHIVKAGKRTYFIDVLETKAGDYFLTIAESKKQSIGEDGKVFFQKHKIYLYKEDFANFAAGLKAGFDFIANKKPNTPLNGETRVEDFTEISTEKHQDNSDNQEAQ